jgi:integrase
VEEARRPRVRWPQTARRGRRVHRSLDREQDGHRPRHTPTLRELALRLLQRPHEVEARPRAPAREEPVEELPETTREALRSDCDWSKTPFLEKLSDVKRVYDGLDPPLDEMYAVGAFAGLRPGEVRALRAENVWLDRGLIHVCESVRNSRLGPPKNGKVRDVLLLDSLRPILERSMARVGGTGSLFRPTTRRGGRTWQAPDVHPGAHDAAPPR